MPADQEHGRIHQAILAATHPARRGPWVIPYVVLLSGEYVVEIIVDMVAALPDLDRDTYVGFVRENLPLIRVLTARANSYWDCYYRHSFPDRRGYPGLVFLRELERWAA